MGSRPIREGDLLALVDRLYDAGLDLRAWPDVLADLSALAGAVCTDMYVMHGEELAFASHGGLPEYVMKEYLTHFHGRTKRSVLLPQAPQGTLLTDLDFMSEEEMAWDPFYQEFMRPLDVGHFLGVSALNNASMRALLAIEMPLRTGPPDASVYELSKAIIPHLRRAVLMQAKLAGAQLHERRLADCIDALAIGIVLLDSRGEVRLANAAAREIFAGSRALGVRRRRLSAANRAENRRLERLIASALGPGPSLTPGGGTLAVGGPGRARPLSVFVCPMPAERRGWDGVAAVVFVSDPEARIEMPTELLRRLYGLTPAEARLTVALVAGGRLDEIADRYGVTRETARSQLKAVFAKTGTHGQADLVRLVLSGVGQVTADGMDLHGLAVGR